MDDLYVERNQPYDTMTERVMVMGRDEYKGHLFTRFEFFDLADLVDVEHGRINQDFCGEIARRFPVIDGVLVSKTMPDPDQIVPLRGWDDDALYCEMSENLLLCHEDVDECGLDKPGILSKTIGAKRFVPHPSNDQQTTNYERLRETIIHAMIHIRIERRLT